jgi:hypothetical protein
MAMADDSGPAPEFHRQSIEAEIERLISILDDLDPDPDLEPSTGYQGAEFGTMAAMDEAEPDADGEPTLGAPECHPFMRYGGWGDARLQYDRSGSQLEWAKGSTQDGEAEPDMDAEPQGDEELTLGAPERHYCAWSLDGSQSYWAQGDNIAGRDDAELVNEDGGDVQDEPHDGEDEDPREYWLAASEHIDQSTWSDLRPGWCRGDEGDGEVDAEYSDERNPLMGNMVWDGMMASYGGKLPASLNFEAFHNMVRRPVSLASIVITGPDGHAYKIQPLDHTAKQQQP